MTARETRHHRLKELLSQHEKLTVDQIVGELAVTGMTVRRDLAALEQAGVLTRTHGGCVPRESFVRELPFEEKSKQKLSQKLSIAREVTRHIAPGTSVYLDTGTTAVQVARALPSGMDLHVFTNNLSVATELFSSKDITVTVYGGTLAGKNPDLVGEMAAIHIADFHVDMAILGTDAIDAKTGAFYSADAATAALSRAARVNATRSIVVADSSKFGKTGLALVGRLDKSTTLVTDKAVGTRERAVLKRSPAKVIYTR